EPWTSCTTSARRKAAPRTALRRPNCWKGAGETSRSSWSASRTRRGSRRNSARPAQRRDFLAESFLRRRRRGMGETRLPLNPAAASRRGWYGRCVS
ncbi:unnamed protein product, partial [Ectocarpus sp. 12 AP-2014]